MPNPNLMQSAGQQLLGMDDRANQINQMTEGLFGSGKQLQAPPPQQPAPYDYSQNEDFRRAQGQWDDSYVTPQMGFGYVAQHGVGMHPQAMDNLFKLMMRQAMKENYPDYDYTKGPQARLASPAQLKAHKLGEV